MKRISNERRTEILAFWRENRHQWKDRVIAKKCGVCPDTLYRIIGLTKKVQKSRITDRQDDVYQFIVNTFAAELRWPTVAEIQDRLAVEHPTMIYRAIRSLEKKGYVRRSKGKHRGFSIPGLAGQLSRTIHRHCHEHFENVKNGTRRRLAVAAT